MKRLRCRPLVLVALSLLCAACGSESLVTVGGSSSDSGGAEATAGTSSTASSTVGTPSTSSGGPATTDDTTTATPGTSTAATESETSETSGPLPGFLLDPDGGSFSVECSVWDQNCPPGQKCMPWASDGGNAWNATKCTPLAPDPDGPGEPCTVEGPGLSGIDSCAAASMCWDVDDKTQTGECVPFCIGSESTPYCTDPSRSCSISADGLAPLCLPHCDPLQQDCGAGQACYVLEGGGSSVFSVCAPDASGDGGAAGDPCEYINACDAGNTCTTAALLPDCTGASSCCSPFCEVSDPVCPGEGSTCIRYYEPGQAPPGSENLGFCGTPR